jgi:hypothetical protein
MIAMHIAAPINSNLWLWFVWVKMGSVIMGALSLWLLSAEYKRWRGNKKERL